MLKTFLFFFHGYEVVLTPYYGTGTGSTQKYVLFLFFYTFLELGFFDMPVIILYRNPNDKISADNPTIYTSNFTNEPRTSSPPSTSLLFSLFEHCTSFFALPFFFFSVPSTKSIIFKSIKIKNQNGRKGLSP